MTAMANDQSLTVTIKGDPPKAEWPGDLNCEKKKALKKGNHVTWKIDNQTDEYLIVGIGAFTKREPDAPYDPGDELNDPFDDKNKHVAVGPNTSNKQIKAKLDRQGPPGTRCPDQGGPPNGRDAYDYKIFVLDLRTGTVTVTQDTAQNGADVEVYDD